MKKVLHRRKSLLLLCCSNVLGATIIFQKKKKALFVSWSQEESAGDTDNFFDYKGITVVSVKHFSLSLFYKPKHRTEQNKNSVNEITHNNSSYNKNEKQED